MKVHQIAEDDAPVRIRLGSSDNSRAQAFLKDFEELSQDHPFSHKQRIIGGAAIEASASRTRNSVHIHDVLTLDPDKGHATRALRLMQKLAAKHSVTLDLFAKAYTKDRKYQTDTKKLVQWYQKLGFEITDEPDEIDFDSGVEMRYIP
jgi:hypothetical protein